MPSRAPWLLPWLAAALAWPGCDDAEPALQGPWASLQVELPRAAPRRLQTADTFDLGPARGCQVQKLDLHLAERATPEPHPRAVPADALVLRVQLHCESGLSLLKTARAVWRPPDHGVGYRPSERTSAPAPADGRLQWVFEVPGRVQLSPQGPYGELRLRSPSGDLDLGLDTRRPAEPSPAEAEAAADACARRTATLRRKLAARFARAHREGPECNVLGWLAPLRCRDVHDTDLLEAAFGQQRACDAPLVRDLARGRGEAAPDDFRIALRRDRCAGSLDRCPRYTLAVYANGVTVFHGEHLVNARGRSDGRTHARLVAGLWRHVQELELLTRKGGRRGRSERCSARGSDRGALITVQGGGRSRTLVDREGCRAPFSAEELAGLAERIDAAAAVDAWTSPQPAYADRHVRVWEVPAETPPGSAPAR